MLSHRRRRTLPLSDGVEVWANRLSRDVPGGWQMAGPSVCRPPPVPTGPPDRMIVPGINRAADLVVVCARKLQVVASIGSRRMPRVRWPYGRRVNHRGLLTPQEHPALGRASASSGRSVCLWLPALECVPARNVWRGFLLWLGVSSLPAKIRRSWRGPAALAVARV